MDYIQFLEIATDTWLTPEAQPISALMRYYKAPIPGNIDLSNKPITNNDSVIDKTSLEILNRIKNRQTKKSGGKKDKK
jgi:hypothetical protein